MQDRCRLSLRELHTKIATSLATPATDEICNQYDYYECGESATDCYWHNVRNIRRAILSCKHYLFLCLILQILEFFVSPWRNEKKSLPRPKLFVVSLLNAWNWRSFTEIQLPVAFFSSLVKLKFWSLTHLYELLNPVDNWFVSFMNTNVSSEKWLKYK